MKKLLLGSTALMAAGALAVSPAAAEDPISLNVGGYYWTGVSISDQDTTGVDYHNVAVRQEGEIHFTGSTTLDNGLTVGVNIQLEAWTGSDQIDEHFIYLSGDWGRVNLGAENDAAFLMGYTAPAAGLGVNSPTVIAFDLVGGSPTNNTLGGTSDSNKITYFTPRFSGFQLGISYTPNTNVKTGDRQTTGLATDNDQGDQSDVISLGANFVESFNGVDIAISGGYVLGDAENNSTDTDTFSASNSTTTGEATVASTVTTAGVGDDLEEWLIGVNVGFSGFTVGGSYGEKNQALSGNFDQTAWDIGATYSTGPWGIGVTYFHGETELGSGGGEDEVDNIELGANYALGPGITIYGALAYREEDNQSTVDTDGISATITTSLSF